MLWAYSFMWNGYLSGLSCGSAHSPSPPCAQRHTQSTDGYWREPMSVIQLLRSYCTGRDVSRAFIAATHALKLSPGPASLPSDQMTMQGWHLLRSTMLTARST